MIGTNPPPCRGRSLRPGAARLAWAVAWAAASLAGALGPQAAAPAADGGDAAAPSEAPRYALVASPRGTQQVLIPAGGGAGGFASASGLQLRLSADWPGKYGYQRVRVEIRAANASAADRHVTLRFSAGSWRTQGRDMTVEQEATLPGGAIEAIVDLAVPRYVDWQMGSLEAWVDGLKDAELAADNLPVLRQGPSETLAVLWTPPGEARPSRLFDSVAEGQVSTMEVPAEELPREWVLYAALDVVAMPAAHVGVLRRSHPEALAALLRWVRAGGNLWLVDSGEQWSELAGVEAALTASRDRPRSGATRSATNDAVATAANGPPEPWRVVPLGERAQQPVESVLAIQGLETLLAAEGAEPVDLRALWQSFQDNAERQLPEGASSESLFLVRNWGFGTLVAFAEVRRPGIGRFVRLSPLRPRLWWSQRHGLVPDAGSPEFNNWLIPGVGVAPVGAFQLLISAFVILIGPVNYLWLMRRRQLPLLVLTAPLGAAAVTLLLFVYGLLGDGFSTKVRARTLTLIDQTSGEAASWARHAYFAGLVPEEGLVLPRDTAIVPVLHGGGGGRRGRRSEEFGQRELAWDDRQRLPRGWLANRTPTQYLLASARPTPLGLQIARDGDGLRVINGLGTAATHLALQDDQGGLYWTESLAAGGSVRLAPADATQVLARLRALFAANEPTYPVGAPAPTLGNRGYYGPYFSGGLLESHLSAFSSPLARELGRRTYLAVTADPVESAKAAPAAREEAGFHVVRGQW